MLRQAIFVVFMTFAALSCHTTATLTTADIDALLALHNLARAVVSPHASPPMANMTWNTAAAVVAQNYANTCPGLNHNPNRTSQYLTQIGSSDPSIYVGENIAEGNPYASWDVSSLFDLWWAENTTWTYAVFNGVSTFGHFTQIIWANTATVGCGLNDCSDWAFLVCDYVQGGNYVGQYPYTIAAPGSSPTPVTPTPTPTTTPVPVGTPPTTTPVPVGTPVSEPVVAPSNGTVPSPTGNASPTSTSTVLIVSALFVAILNHDFF